ncbi:MAG TPA: RNA-binding cell elongation regulator Jag/EloR [Candidatus Binatia bacterium]|nr:RNA-binding cell elongation regulator Jag/EloR [Candidatus Binatia bacterium]
MRSIESEADTIDEAIAKALGVLGVGREQVEIEILTDAERGFFGFGGRKARVRATQRASLLDALADESPTGHRNVSRETNPAPANVSRETRPAPAANVSRETFGRDDRRADALPASVSDAFRERARTVLTELLRHLDAECSIAVAPGEDVGTVLLAVTGDSGGLLIGRRGQTLDALEYIVNRIVAREDGEAGRVVIDVERYRERRQEYLTTLAQRLADKVRHTGRVVTLNPMSPRDRRIVHLALRSDAAVATRSQGDGHYRRILIVPADRPRQPRQSGQQSG